MADMTPEERAEECSALHGHNLSAGQRATVAEAIRAAVLAEREACATIADACANQNRNAEISAARQGDAIAEDVMREVKHEARAIADAIRARGRDIHEERMDAYQFGKVDPA